MPGAEEQALFQALELGDRGARMGTVYAAGPGVPREANGERAAWGATSAESMAWSGLGHPVYRFSAHHSIRAGVSPLYHEARPDIGIPCPALCC